MIQAKFGLNWSSGFGEDFLKNLQTDGGRQVMAIAHTGELKKRPAFLFGKDVQVFRIHRLI
jgi:hypothetical protein